MPKRFIRPSSLPTGKNDIPVMSMQLFGDWEKAIKVFHGLGPKVKESSIAAQLKLCKEIVKRVKGHLRNQDLGWKPLSTKYQQRKAAAGISSNTLMAYKTYYESIETWQSGNKGLILVGVRKGIFTKQLNGKKSKLDVATIATIHEFSNGKRIPKRPLWNPTIKEMGGAKGMKQMYIKALVWHLRRKGIPVQTGSGTNLYMNNTKINPFK